MMSTTKTLNIKDPEAHRLAEALARATGQSMTRVVTDALRNSLDALESRREKASVDELLAIAKRVSAKVKRPYIDHADYLYDEKGLPR
jgi:antitoxin VapB